MIDGRIRNGLMEHLKALHGRHQKLYFGDMAAAIMDDPQRHIDALVDAGVLQPGVDPWLGQPGPAWYSVVKPHVHEWRVSNSTTVVNPGDTVILRCGCGEKYNVENRLPIEAP